MPATLSEKQRNSHGALDVIQGEFTISGDLPFTLETGLGFIVHFELRSIDSSDVQGVIYWNSDSNAGDDQAGEGGKVYLESALGNALYVYKATGWGA